MMTRKERRAKSALPAAVLSALAALFSGITLIGHPARLAHVLALFATSFAAGLSTAKALSSRKALAAAAPDPTPAVLQGDGGRTGHGV